MSVEIPKMAVAFGGYGIPQGDVVECRIHLGCTKEVSSFDLLLQNWNGKYCSGGSIPLIVGMDGRIDIGRGANVPQIITCRIESIKYESSPSEHYVRVSGRCWGERLFRRVFTGVFQNMKGEDIIKHLLDYYVGLSHTRDGQELVEATDTTYTWLEYENTPVWDIIKYIAESADKQGVIGFDFRIAPDGKFEFFPRNSKTSPVSLAEKIEVCEYRRDIHRIRNRILVLGANEKRLPTDANEDGLTESLTNWAGYYLNHDMALSADHVSADGEVKYLDSYSVHVYPSELASVKNATGMYRIINAIKCRGPSGFKQLRFWLKWDREGDGDPASVKVRLYTDAANYYYKEVRSDVGEKGEWKKIALSLEEYWAPVGSPDWNNITRVGFIIEFSEDCNPRLWVDHIVFENCRFSAVQEDTASQNVYGLRELTETDEELYSDNECLLRAKALLAHLKDPVEYITVKSTIIDYGGTPLLPGDKIHVALPNENVDADYRIISVEYRVDAKTQTLEITLELGKEIPLLADYLYGLRSTTVNVEKLARTKMGKGYTPIFTRVPADHTHSFKDLTFADHFLPLLDDAYDIGSSEKRWRHLYLSGAVKALEGGVALNLLPDQDAARDLGSISLRWSNLYLAGLARLGWLNIGDYTVISSERVLQNVSADAAIIASGQFPLARLPRGPQGYVLEAEGPNFDPMYVDPNYRYQPAAHQHPYTPHTHAGETISPNQVNCNTLSAAVKITGNAFGNLFPETSDTGAVGTTSKYWNCVAANSVWYKALGQFDALDDLALIKRIRGNGKTDERGLPLADPESLPPEVVENGLINAGALMGLLIGAVKQLAARVEALEKRLGEG